MKGREKLLKKFNEAFANCDTEFLANSVTDDIVWNIVGEKLISGRKDFEKSLDRMRHGGPTEIFVNEMIISDDRSVVEGIVEFYVEPGKKKKYAFCDVYVFSEIDDTKFKELRTYVALLNKKGL
ncbi:nuclear transport factor 2 family protein [Christiangramia echinicola]|uniref:nuclear transport factor 2 family protein n=1 Tax=Christiangramia echinicola TaxID=279359 RepID=UPI00041EDDE2|nr:nuclear transport factor 2 family protein [Christiangramia echinicola]